MKTVATVLGLALVASLAIMGIIALESWEKRPHVTSSEPPAAREGTALAVSVSATYSDPARTPASGLRLRVRDDEEGAEFAVAINQWGQGELTLLAGRTYTFTATLRDSVMSLQDTVYGWAPQAKGQPGYGGRVSIFVEPDDNSIDMVWVPPVTA